MRIALFTDTYPPYINGVSTSCFNLATTLREHGHYVLVVTPRYTDGKLEIKDDIILLPGLQIKDEYGYRVTKIFDKKVTKVLKDRKIELIHNQTDFTAGVFARIAAKRLKLPLVYTYHTSYEDYTYYVTKGIFDRMAKKIVRYYTKNIAAGAAGFITPSIKTKDFMRSVGHDIFINVIPTGIDFSIFEKDRIDQERVKAFKEEHGIDEDTKVVLILGRIAKEKSVDTSVKYFAKYVERHPEMKVKLLVVGDGPQRSEIELLTHELHISHLSIFTGFVKADEVPFYYHLGDVYNSASTTETQGLTFMEAMAARSIVLARFDDNLTNTIIDGQTGFFFMDEESYLNKLDHIFKMKDEEKETIINNALQVIDQYSMDKFYARIIEVYKRAVRNYW